MWPHPAGTQGSVKLECDHTPAASSHRIWIMRGPIPADPSRQDPSRSVRPRRLRGRVFSWASLFGLALTACFPDLGYLSADSDAMPSHSTGGAGGGSNPRPTGATRGGGGP